MKRNELTLLNGTLFAIVGLGFAIYFLDVIVGAFQGLIFAFKHPSQFVIMGGILLGIFLVCEILGRISDKIQSRKREW